MPRPALLLVAEALEAPSWPAGMDGVDGLLTFGYLAVIIGVPVLGYAVMVMDFRRYLRSLRRAMVMVAQSVRKVPYWALNEQPSCLTELGLRLPCTEEEVMAAYRERVKELHPDRGGDLQSFLRLQKHFEQAMYLVRGQARQEAGE